MNADEWTQAMAYYGALWPQSAPTDASGQAWRTVYGHEPQADVLHALRLCASQFGRRFGPAPGEITQALDGLRKPRPATFTAPELPSGQHATAGQQLRARRSRILAKLLDGALDLDGEPSDPKWVDDPDLWAFDTDPLIAEMHRDHLKQRRQHAAPPKLTEEPAA